MITVSLGLIFIIDEPTFSNRGAQKHTMKSKKTQAKSRKGKNPRSFKQQNTKHKTLTRPKLRIPKKLQTTPK